ncbi:PDZ domain-containing protein [candidate division KSB1 bacterium]|nr:PDZ domain-containing protein [candidate division KSB1 bacterium]
MFINISKEEKMFNKRNLTVFAFLALLVMVVTVFGGWMAHKTDTAKPDYYFAISKNISVFGKVYEEITKRYVEVIDPEKFMRAGIYGMMKTLDPYTVFIEKEANDELQIMTHGKYGGVGMRISKRDDWPAVIEPPFEGTPAERAGIREGDLIIAVDSVSTEDLSISETANRLRGKPGTAVYVKIRRVGEEKPLEFRLIRAEIKVEEITYSGLIEDNIGYIRLAHFSRNVGNQIYNSIADLKKEGMEALILDLRGNPGGLLESAVSVADNFVEKGQMIVSTRGKLEGTSQEYRAKVDPIWGTEPLVVLVDTVSASASEIVAGALQDLDRAVVIGNPTFGKGLVQTVIPISKETALKVTTAKYYIPSGRLIQKPNAFEDKEVLLTSFEKEQDSTLNFETLKGRKVTGGGGIIPDIVIKTKHLPLIVRHMIMKSMFFNYSLEYAATNKELERDFEVDHTMINNFKKFLKEKDFDYNTAGEEELKVFKDIAKEKGYLEQAELAFEELQEIIEKRKEQDFDEAKDFIKLYLKKEIAGKFWGTAAKVEAGIEVSEEVQKAIEVLSDQNEYYAILNNNANLN